MEDKQSSKHQWNDQMNIIEFINMIKSKQLFQLIDVRNQEEYENDHIENSMLIPLDRLDNQLHLLDVAIPIVLYCRSGKRSQMAQEYLKSKGVSNVINLVGGIDAYNKEIKEK